MIKNWIRPCGQAKLTEVSFRSFILSFIYVTLIVAFLFAKAEEKPVIDGGITTAYNTTGNPLIALGGFGGSTFPSGYLNYILFDEHYKPIKAKSFPVQNLPSTRHTVQFDVPLEIKELGYLFVYLSYDNNQSSLYLYFDDLKITVDESPLIQVNNYYPFGMVSGTWLREGEQNNAKLFQGKELISQTGWHDFGSRMYWADLGRWFSTDPQKQFSSPYVGMGNMPVMGVDPNGEIFQLIPFLLTLSKIYGYASTAYGLAEGYSKGGWEGLGKAFASSAVSFGVGAIAGAALGGILPDVTNTMGAFKGAGLGGLTGALGGGLAGGLTSSIGGGDFWEGFGNGALTGGITGALGGAHWGANNAYNAGKNVWWGTNLSEGQDNQFSFFNPKVPESERAKIFKTGNSGDNELKAREYVEKQIRTYNTIQRTVRISEGKNKAWYAVYDENGETSTTFKMARGSRGKMRVNGRRTKVDEVTLTVPNGMDFVIGNPLSNNTLLSGPVYKVGSWNTLINRMGIGNVTVQFIKPKTWGTYYFEWGKRVIK
jgi:RHS repeat-associated protein